MGFVGVVQDKMTGYFAKLSFRSISALHAIILSSTYDQYACGKIIACALILNQNHNFPR